MLFEVFSDREIGGGKGIDASATCQPNGCAIFAKRGGESKAGEQKVTKTRQPTRKIFGKKRGRLACNFTETHVQAECVRREQELEDAELLTLDGGKFISGCEAALDHLEGVECCRDVVSKHARRSARVTGEAIAEIRDSYDTIVIELLAARYTQTDGKSYSLGTVLRDKYESDSALKEFLPKFAKWIGEYVSDCIHEHESAFTPLYRQIVPAHTWTLSRHIVGRELLTALAEEYVRDREGLLRFLCAVFKRWRKIDQSRSAWRVKLVTEQHANDVPHHRIAQRLEKIDAVPKGTVVPGTSAYRKLRSKIKKIRSRDREAALQRRTGDKTAKHKPKLSPQFGRTLMTP